MTKPKTLEELGWETWTSGKTIHYDDGTNHIHFYGNLCVCETEYIALTYEEILAIAEKMKELGMTN